VEKRKKGYSKERNVSAFFGEVKSLIRVGRRRLGVPGRRRPGWCLGKRWNPRPNDDLPAELNLWGGGNLAGVE
jgi:hypothetical protein